MKTRSTAADKERLQRWLQPLDLYTFFRDRCRTALFEWAELVQEKRSKRGKVGKALVLSWSRLRRGSSAQAAEDYQQRALDGAAAFVLKHRLDPDLCQRVWPTIDSCLVRSTRMSAEEIFHHAFLDNYLAAQAREEALCEYELVRCAQVLRTEVTLLQQLGQAGAKASWRYVLNDTNSLSPLFRFCVAWSEGMNASAARYALEAAHQYSLRMSGYNTHWRGYLPGEFKKLVSDAYAAAVDRSTECRTRTKRP